jgi:hypothetical protein
MAKHQARNDSHFEAPVQTLVPTRDDLLARLRLLFGL